MFIITYGKTGVHKKHTDKEMRENKAGEKKEQGHTDVVLVQSKRPSLGIL